MNTHTRTYARTHARTHARSAYMLFFTGRQAVKTKPDVTRTKKNTLLSCAPVGDMTNK
jgi:hypothetical protein